MTELDITHISAAEILKDPIETIPVDPYSPQLLLAHIVEEKTGLLEVTSTPILQKDGKTNGAYADIYEKTPQGSNLYHDLLATPELQTLSMITSWNSDESHALFEQELLDKCTWDEDTKGELTALYWHQKAERLSGTMNRPMALNLRTALNASIEEARQNSLQALQGNSARERKLPSPVALRNLIVPVVERSQQPGKFTPRVVK